MWPLTLTATRACRRHRQIRDRLVAEHLGLRADAVARGVERAGSLRAFIDSRARADRTLVPMEVGQDTPTQVSEALRAAADPDEPVLSGSLVADLVPPLDATRKRRGISFVTNGLLVPPSLLAVVAGAWLGWLRGGLVALLASLVIAAIGYAIGRAIGPGGLPRWMSRRAYRYAAVGGTRRGRRFDVAPGVSGERRRHPPALRCRARSVSTS